MRAMAKKNHEPTTPPESPSWKTAKVTLPKIGGIEPTLYVTLLYGFAFLFLLFLVFFVPGLFSPFARVSITSTPPGAAVFFGERAYGYTPTEVSVPSGETMVVLKRPGFPEFSEKVLIPNQPILSWLFPAYLQLKIQFQPGDVEKILTRFESDLSEISLAAPFEENRQPPPLFTDLKNDLLACGFSMEQVREQLKKFVTYVNDFYLYKDFRLAYSEELPKDFESELAFWENQLTNKPFLPIWVYHNQPLTEKYNLAQAPFWSELKSFMNPLGSTRTLIPARMSGFFELPLGIWTQGPRDLKDLPREEPFLVPYRFSSSRVIIKRNLITQGEFAAFLKSNPFWSLTNKDALIQQRLVDDRYLEFWEGTNPPNPSEPVVNISAYAAEAYLSYYNLLNNVRARLPFDHEWEAAHSLNPGIYEWMANPFRSMEFVLYDVDSVRQAPKGVVRSVRSNVNREKGINTIFIRGALPPDFCSPNVGFRMVIE
jgi:hypothetical protein